MPSAKLAMVSSLAALALSACGAVAVKPVAKAGSARLASRGRVDDPRTANSNRVMCLHDDGLPVSMVGAIGLQIGPRPAGPSVTFEPTPGAAEAMQIDGQAPAAEVIGNALLYPNQGSDAELKKIETCLSRGVAG